MPTYEYECDTCGLIEIVQSIKDSPLTTCPNCQQNCIKRILSIFSSHFKGEGWTPKFYNSEKTKK